MNVSTWGGLLSPAEHAPSCNSPNAEMCVAILMATYNGEGFLRKQLDSIMCQSHQNWVLHVSDDGSSDSTLDIVREYAEKLPQGRVHIHEGPRMGFAQNFLSLVRRREVIGDFYAFCDQDDIWLEDKISRALSMVKVGGGYLYCSRTFLINEVGCSIGLSPLFQLPPSFCNALVQSIAGANTMLFDSRIRELLAQVPQDARVISHDWLAYMLAAGCGAVVEYDSQPSLMYRQHQQNLIGTNTTISGRVARFFRMLEGDYRGWNSSNLSILKHFEASLTPDSQMVLQRFSIARASAGAKGLILLRRSGVRRQTAIENMGLGLAALLGRV